MTVVASPETASPAKARRFFSGERFSRPGLTGLRALAAGWVMAFHLNAFVGPVPLHVDLGFARFETTHLLTEGWVGVDIFFVLSGFLLTLHVLERAGEGTFGARYATYLRGRVLRVVPAYWAQIAVLLAAALLLTGALPPWTRDVPAHLVFLQNLSERAHAAINGIYWTLPVEFSFYLVLPFVVAWLCGRGEAPSRSRALAAVVAAIAITLAWRVNALRIAGGTPSLFWHTAAFLPGSIDQFAWGVAAATVFRLRPGARHGTDGRLGDALLAAGAIALVAWMHVLHVRVEGFWSGSWLYYAWHPVAGACIAAMVFGVACGGRLARAAFENAPVLWLGTVSYSVWHRMHLLYKLKLIMVVALSTIKKWTITA